MTRKEYDALIGAWEEIKRHCDDAKAGDFCPFAAGGVCKEFIGNCAITSAAFPNGWSRPNPFKLEWTEAEREVAKAIASGFRDVEGTVVRKIPGIAKSAVYFIGKTGDAVAMVPAEAFPSLTPERPVKLSDIIREG